MGPHSKPLLPLQLVTEDSDGGDTKRKGRSFTAACLGWVTAPLLGVSSGRATAPVFIALAGPATTLKPFAANFLHGDAKAVVRNEHSVRHVLQRDKSQPLRHRWHRGGQQSLLLAWHPAFELDPDPLFLGAGRPELTFVHMPRRDWIQRQAERFASYANPLLTARAAHFCAYLSRRTRLPIANDPGFYLHLHDSALEAGWTAQGTETSKAIRQIGLDAYEPPTLVSAKADEFEDWLRERTREFFGAASSTATTTRKAA